MDKEDMHFTVAPHLLHPVRVRLDFPDGEPEYLECFVKDEKKFYTLFEKMISYAGKYSMHRK